MLEYFAEQWETGRFEREHESELLASNLDYGWCQRSEYEAAHPCLIMAKLMNDIRFAHVPWQELGDAASRAIARHHRSYTKRWDFRASSWEDYDEDTDKETRDWREWHFISFKPPQYGDPWIEPVVYKTRFVDGVSDKYGWSCVLCKNVHHMKLGSRAEEFIRDRFKHAMWKRFVGLRPIMCERCSEDFEKFTYVDNWGTFKKHDKAIKTLEKKCERVRKKYWTEQGGLPNGGRGHSAKKLNERYPDLWQDRDARKKLEEICVLRWLNDRLAKSIAAAPVGADANG